MTAPEILNEMQNRVLNDEPISPASWVESALRINAMRGELDNRLVGLEMILGDNIAKLINEGKPATVADKLSRTGETYKQYLELRAELKRIDEFVRLAKRRASINEY